MYDTHCHILPGIDDGSDSLRSSVMMAAIAADDGISDIIATPHVLWNASFSRSDFDKIKALVSDLNDVLNKEHIPVNIYTGAEVLCKSLCNLDMFAEHFPRINETDYVLAEFFYNDSEEHINSFLSAIENAGLRPIIAHPERYRAVQKNRNIAISWKERGYLIQVNAGSFFGEFGKNEKLTAEWLASVKLISMLGTDSHDIYARKPKLSKAVQYIERKTGAEYAEAISQINPSLVLKNEMCI